MEGAWWAASFVFHTLLMAVLMLVPHTVSSPVEGDAPSFESAEGDLATQQPPKLERFEVGQANEMPADLNTETLTLTKAPDIQSSNDLIDVTGQGVEAGGFTGAASGPQAGRIGRRFHASSGWARGRAGSARGARLRRRHGERPGTGGSGSASATAPQLKKSLGSPAGPKPPSAPWPRP